MNTTNPFLIVHNNRWQKYFFELFEPIITQTLSERHSHRPNVITKLPAYIVDYTTCCQICFGNCFSQINNIFYVTFADTFRITFAIVIKLQRNWPFCPLKGVIDGTFCSSGNTYCLSWKIKSHKIPPKRMLNDRDILFYIKLLRYFIYIWKSC